MADDAGTLRAALRHRAPRDFQLKRAWRALVQANRLRRRASGERGVLMGQGDVARALSRPVSVRGPAAEAALDGLKADLRDLSRGGGGAAERMALAARIDRAVATLVPLPATAPVSTSVTGWPAGVDAPTRTALTGLSRGGPGLLSPAAAALLVHRLDGYPLAGGRLRVQVAVPAGRALPAVPRSDRADRGRWGRGDPWLAHLDEEGRFSLTSEPVARAQAARLPAGAPVVDACCGCGGNAVAFARAGHRVVGVEPDAGRRALAARNLTDHGVTDQVELVAGLAEREGLAAGSAQAGAVLFLDPPWGGPGAPASATADWLSARPALLRAPRVMIKLPRDFPVDQLPDRPDGWVLWLEVEADPSGGAGAVRMLTVAAGLPRPAPATVQETHPERP
jgi:16S rRNA G966 N2-methylase RsmD